MRALAPFHGRILWRDCVSNMLTLGFCIDLVYFEVEVHTISNIVCSRSMYNILWYSANNYDITLTHNWLVNYDKIDKKRFTVIRKCSY